MNIELLKYVLEIERVGSISQAADNLYMGQPNLSKAIKELEYSLNVTLFDRTSKGVRTTKQGKKFLRHARIILEQYGELEALGQNPSTRLYVSLPHTGYLADACAAFLNKLNPEQELSMEWLQTDTKSAIRQISDGTTDLGVIRCPAEYQNYFTGLLQDNGLVGQNLLTFSKRLLFSRSHPLAKQDSITHRDLSPYPEIIPCPAMPPDRSGSAEVILGRPEGSKKIRIYGGGNNLLLLNQIRHSYMTDAPLPDHLLNTYGLLQKECYPSQICHDLLICRSGHSFHSSEMMFLDTLKHSAAPLSDTRND